MLEFEQVTSHLFTVQNGKIWIGQLLNQVIKASLTQIEFEKMEVQCNVTICVGVQSEVSG